MVDSDTIRTRAAFRRAGRTLSVAEAHRTHNPARCERGTRYLLAGTFQFFFFYIFFIAWAHHGAANSNDFWEFSNEIYSNRRDSRRSAQKKKTVKMEKYTNRMWRYHVESIEMESPEIPISSVSGLMLMNETMQLTFG